LTSIIGTKKEKYYGSQWLPSTLWLSTFFFSSVERRRNFNIFNVGDHWYPLTLTKKNIMEVNGYRQLSGHQH